MIAIDDIIVSDDLFLVRFCCNLPKCYGACCVEGDAGAPLEEEEISLLEDHIRKIKPYMTDRGKDVISEIGVFDYDAQGKFATPLVRDSECAYCNFSSDGVAWCTIERAYEEGKIGFQKPVSCHLYPVRLLTYDDFEAVNYHKWHVCKSALKHGKNKGVMLYQFLKSSLIRKYGEDWYKKLDQAVQERLNDQV
jgi:hypothetical protein